MQYQTKVWIHLLIPGFFFISTIFYFKKGKIHTVCVCILCEWVYVCCCCSSDCPLRRASVCVCMYVCILCEWVYVCCCCSSDCPLRRASVCVCMCVCILCEWVYVCCCCSSDCTLRRASVCVCVASPAKSCRTSGCHCSSDCPHRGASGQRLGCDTARLRRRAWEHPDTLWRCSSGWPVQSLCLSYLSGEKDEHQSICYSHLPKPSCKHSSNLIWLQF
jgi:hypothetical protein